MLCNCNANTSGCCASWIGFNIITISARNSATINIELASTYLNAGTRGINHSTIIYSRSTHPCKVKSIIAFNCSIDSNGNITCFNHAIDGKSNCTIKRTVNDHIGIRGSASYSKAPCR